MSIRQVLIAIALAAIFVSVGISIYQNSSSKSAALPTSGYLLDDLSEDALKQIQHDLELFEEDFTVLELTQTNLFEQGVREEALIQSRDKGFFRLRYLYRSDDNSTERPRWRIWTNYVAIGDGTGAESLAVQEFDQLPTVEQIAAFKAKTVQ